MERRPDGLTLLVEHNGKWEPDVARVERMIKQLQAEKQHNQVPHDCWEVLQGTTSKKGPISLLRHTLESNGVARHNLDV